MTNESSGVLARGENTRSRVNRVCSTLLMYLLLVAFSWRMVLAQQPPPPDPGIAGYSEVADRLIDAALADTVAFRRLEELVDTFGPRFSGTPNLEAAIDWTIAAMKADGLENVRGEPVLVPHWVRGNESLEMTAPRFERLRMLGLGSSVGTSREGITAPLMIVSSFEELTRRAPEAKGKIVLFDVPFTTYPETVRYRVGGAVAAARAGAVASLVRSVASYSIASPHTGNMRYDTGVTRIPAAAVSVEDAMLLHRLSRKGTAPIVHLTMSAQTLPDVQSRNVVAEIVGREMPDEIVLLGGHIDSWDVGQGAMDDGGGMIAAWEAVRLMKSLGLRPRRTVRVIAWTNEENGGRGNLAYRDRNLAELGRHDLAIESDNGPFRPNGFRFSGSDSALTIAREIGTLLHRIGADTVEKEMNAPEADIAPLVERGVPGMGLNVDRTNYFWFHHSSGDTLDKLNPQDLAHCIATMAVMAYVMADMPARLPRQVKP
jgi:carboxypeptidase Q